MRTCPKCRGKLIKYGFLKKERTQKYRCTSCKKMCSEAPNRAFGTLRTKPEKIVLVVQFLTEGMSIRGAARLSNLHRDTVLRILKFAGIRSYERMQKKLVDVKPKHVQGDEIWTYVLRKSDKSIDPEHDTNPWGDYFVYLGIDSESKLLFMPTIGKRTMNKTDLFAESIAKATSGSFQLTTDGFGAYRGAFRRHLGDRVSFAQIYKEHHMLNAISKKKRDVHCVRWGSPDKSRITTAHVERVNLSLRTSNKRFVRKTICFSKDAEYLAYSTYLWAAAYNFCTPHSAHAKKTTPAMIAGIETKPLTIAELIANL